MEIPNLAKPIPVENTESITFSVPILLTVLVVALVSGFWISRFFPQSNASSSNQTTSTVKTSTDNISSTSELKVGQIYGNTEKTFKDAATGVIEKGSINGEGTHILNREGGASQRASLTSSAIDLDLFVGKKVEVKGETNASTKTSWLLDVGNIKVIE